MSFLATRRALSACCRHHHNLRVLAAALPQATAVPPQVMRFSSLDRRSSSNSNTNKNISSKTTVAAPSRPSSSEVFERTVYVHPLSQIILEYFQDCRSEWIIRRGLDRSLTLHRDGSFELSLSEEDNRIWTSYDEKEKKHWLTVHYKGGNLHERFLLQDNLLPSWHSNRKSLPERVHMAVEEMISAVDRMDVLDDDNNGGNNGRN